MKKTILTVVLALALAAVYYCISYIQAPVTTTTATPVTYEDVVDADAFIVRKETVYNTASDGVLYSFAREGARVGKDHKIAGIYSSDVDETLLRELGTINEKIAELSSVVISESYTHDSGSVERRLLQLYSEIEQAAAVKDVKKVSECKAEIERIASGGVPSTNADKIAELSAEKAELESKVNAAHRDIISTVAGIYSTKLDGYENVLTVDSLEGMTVEKLKDIKPETVSDSEKSKKSDLDIVTANNAVCKIIDNHEWYIMALVEKSGTENLKKGSRVSVRFEKLPGEVTEATVYAISNEPEGQEKAVLVLKSESYLEGAFSTRVSKVEIIKSSYTGFEVPIHAIRVQNGQNGVVVRVGGSDIFKPCRIVYNDEESGKAILKADTDDPNRQLRQFDMIVVGEK